MLTGSLTVAFILTDSDRQTTLLMPRCAMEPPDNGRYPRCLHS